MNSSNLPWILLLVLWIGGSTWWHVCKIKMLCYVPKTTLFEVPEVTVPPLHVMDGADFMLTADGNIAFARSGDQASLTQVKKELDAVVNYLRSNPDRRLILTGYYSANEINATSWENLGLARAENVKNYYTQNGLPGQYIYTKGKLSGDLVFDRDSLWGGIDHLFMDALAFTETRLAEEQKFEDIFKPLDLYFNTGSATYIATPDNERFIEEAKLYLSQNPDKKILLTGHTDNVGSDESNMLLANERAESVKSRLLEFGISEEQIMVDAKGKSEPKASNNTPEGQAANRRVTIIVLNQT